MFKRNFTFGLASPTASNDGAAWVPGTGPAESWTHQDGTFPIGTDGGDVRAIACAVNTFGQHDIFHAPVNGLCYNGEELAPRGGACCHDCLSSAFSKHANYCLSSGFGSRPSFSSCEVVFGAGGGGGGGGPTKRSIGQFNGWDVISKILSLLLLSFYAHTFSACCDVVRDVNKVSGIKLKDKNVVDVGDADIPPDSRPPNHRAIHLNKRHPHGSHAA